MRKQTYTHTHTHRRWTECCYSAIIVRTMIKVATAVIIAGRPSRLLSRGGVMFLWDLCCVCSQRKKVKSWGDLHLGLFHKTRKVSKNPSSKAKIGNQQFSSVDRRSVGKEGALRATHTTNTLIYSHTPVLYTKLNRVLLDTSDIRSLFLFVPKPLCSAVNRQRQCPSNHRLQR